MLNGLLAGAMQGFQDPYQLGQGAVDPWGMGSGAVQGAQQSLDDMIRAAAPYGQGAINAAVNAYNAQRAGLSIFPSQPTPTQEPVANTDLTAIGQSEGWLSPEELRNKSGWTLPTLGANLQTGGSGGGSGGTSGGAVGQGLTNPGGLLGGLPSGASGGTSGGTPGFPPQLSSGGQLGNYLPNQATQPNQFGAPLDMQRQDPQATLSNYYNTPGYQLLFGQDTQSRFQQSPGYQFAVDEAMKQVQRNASSRGLLESGNVMREMSDRAQQMANQEYGNWWNRQAQQYGDYQNRLAGLAGGNTGADYAMQLGQGLGQTAFNTGNNIASLLGNQGNNFFSGLANTSAAQTNNMMQAANMQAQLNAANQSTLMAGALSSRRGLF